MLLLLGNRFRGQESIGTRYFPVELLFVGALGILSFFSILVTQSKSYFQRMQVVNDMIRVKNRLSD